MNFKILARLGDYDIELDFQIEEVSECAAIVVHCQQEGINPRPRFQQNGPKVELPFDGVIEKTELVPAKDGKREYCLAHVKHEDGTIVPVRYFPPQKTWKANERAHVQKGQYGPELKEISEEDAIPF